VKRQYHVIIERDSEGYLVATVPELKGCHTQAKSLDILLKRVREAIKVCLGRPPENTSGEYARPE
jgi:predicted RNase H-like HicB family nuclease